MRKPVVAKRVNIPALNRRAMERTHEFKAAIERLGEAVHNAEKIALKADDKGRISWSSPTAEELRHAGKRAARATEVLASSIRRWEKELVSREWRR